MAYRQTDLCRSIYQVKVKYHPVFTSIYQVDTESDLDKLHEYVDWLKSVWGNDKVQLKSLGHPTKFITELGE